MPGAAYATDSQSTYTTVEENYAYRATNAIKPSLSQSIARALGYKDEDFVDVPQSANIGEGCGNPLAIANLKPGDVVLDMGCGGGFDVFQASKVVGPAGKVIGIDMTEAMINLAKRNAEQMGVKNVEFIHCKATDIPLPAESVDCIISNCVLNLVPEGDKKAVLKTLQRILRPQGRIAMSDFLALKPLPDEMKGNKALISGCVAGAMEVDRLQKTLNELGFGDVLLIDKKLDLSIYNDADAAKSITPCCAGATNTCSMGDALTESGRQIVPYDLNEWISSFDIYAHKLEGKDEKEIFERANVVEVTDSTSQNKCGGAGVKKCC